VVGVSLHLDRLRVEGPRLAGAAERAGLDAPVPTCPGWLVRDLLRHAGGVHRWAAAHVAGARPRPLPAEEVTPLFAAPDDDKLVAWYRDGHADLVATLAAADPATACWAFLPAPSPLAFWTRRQAHETAVHRADAESATGPVSAVPAGFARDGIDELLFGFLSRPRGRLVADPPRSLAVQATDVDAAWTVHIEPDRRRVVAAREPADLTVTGPASDLYLLLWNRRDASGLAVDGDPAVLDLWRAAARVTWN
jgi:uncharacterized protein (TIGR03083 family)